MTTSQLPTEKFEPTEPLLGMLTAVVDWFKTLRVEPGLNSLSKAVIKARKEGYTKILLLNGTHNEGGKRVEIPISISGESREGCIVLGGLSIHGKKEDDVNVSNLTLRDSNSHGVWGYNGASVHFDNVSVKNSKGYGLFIFSTERNTMKNCNVSSSKRSGVAVHGGGLMTIDGNGTTIHHNCTDGNSSDYGLYVFPSSSIHLVSPLTSEAISTDNGGGGNVGGGGIIDIVDSEYSSHYLRWLSVIDR